MATAIQNMGEDHRGLNLSVAEEPPRASGLGHKTAHLRLGEDNWQARGELGLDDIVQPGELNTQNHLEEKQEGRLDIVILFCDFSPNLAVAERVWVMIGEKTLNKK